MIQDNENYKDKFTDEEEEQEELKTHIPFQQSR